MDEIEVEVRAFSFLYAQPSRDARVAGDVTAGERLRVLADAGDFVQVERAGAALYIEKRAVAWPAAVVQGARTCPGCGYANQSDASFCANCGARLPEPAIRPPAPAPPPRAAPAAPAPPGKLSGERLRNAVLLELLPLGAPIIAGVASSVLFAIAVLPGGEVGGLFGAISTLMLLATFISGIGWIYAGRTAIGCSLMAARVFVMGVSFAGLLVAAFGDFDCYGDECSEGEVAALVFVAIGVFAFAAVPVLSALVLWATLREGAAAQAAERL